MSIDRAIEEAKEYANKARKLGKSGIAYQIDQLLTIIEQLTETQYEHIDLIHHAYRVIGTKTDLIHCHRWLMRYEKEMIVGGES